MKPFKLEDETIININFITKIIGKYSDVIDQYRYTIYFNNGELIDISADDYERLYKLIFKLFKY